MPFPEKIVVDPAGQPVSLRGNTFHINPGFRVEGEQNVLRYAAWKAEWEYRVGLCSGPCEDLRAVIEEAAFRALPSHWFVSAPRKEYRVRVQATFEVEIEVSSPIPPDWEVLRAAWPRWPDVVRSGKDFEQAHEIGLGIACIVEEERVG